MDLYNVIYYLNTTMKTLSSPSIRYGFLLTQFHVKGFLYLVRTKPPISSKVQQ